MNNSGKYCFPLELNGTVLQITVLARKYYNGKLHVTVISDHDDYVIPKDVVAASDRVTFSGKISNVACTFRLEKSVSGCEITVEADGKSLHASSDILEITAEDDRTAKADYKYKALILYSSLTGNTEKIALCFQETLEHYGFSVDFMKVTSKLNISRDFSAYDLVCLGSMIIAGSPAKVLSKKLSLGGGDGAPTGDPMPAGGPGGPPSVPDLSGMPQGGGDGTVGSGDNTPMAASYAGGPSPHGTYQPLGLVFTTYGGGFYGSNETMATLELLKLYLELQNVVVVGKFSCCGKETGPAGLSDGEIPVTFGGVKLEPPVYYKDADGRYHAGSFFFHTHMNDKPCDRDLNKARYLMADLIEDYFFTNDGIRRNAASQYISIS